MCVACDCSLGEFGACFQSGLYRIQDAIVYASRPGLRIWKASTQGVVLATYMFKDLLNGSTPTIPLLKDSASKHPSGKIEEKNFGPLSVFDEDKLVTWHEGALYLINPNNGSFVGWKNNLGQILNVAVSKDEIFILRRGHARRVLRVSTKRDPLNETGIINNILQLITSN